MVNFPLTDNVLGVHERAGTLDNVLGPVNIANCPATPDPNILPEID